MSDTRTNVQLGPEFDLPYESENGPPSRHAFQCQDCGGIAYNPSCPYCEERRAESRGLVKEERTGASSC